MESDEVTAEKSLLRVKNVCSFISVVLKIILAILLVYWITAGILTVFSPENQESVDGALLILKLLLYATYGSAAVVMFVMFIKMFSDAAKGESPFTLNQVKRLRWIAAMLLLCTVFDFAISANASLVQYGGINAGFYSTNSNVIVQLNFAPLIAAAVVFAFSFVFKYGVLLQEFSDETL